MKKTKTKIITSAVLCFSDFFPFQRLDIVKELKRFDRDKLIKAVSILGLNYQNACFPGTIFFSNVSVKYKNEINRRFNRYRAKKGVNMAFFCTYKTSMELLRYVYSIPYEEFKDTIGKADFEYNLFRILLKINEQLFDSYDKRSTHENLPLALYALRYSTNDLVIPNFNHVFFTQLYYGRMLFGFLTTNNKAKQQLYDKFLQEFGVNDWQEYVSTFLVLYSIFNCFQKEVKKGLLPIKIEMFAKDVRHLVNENVLIKKTLGSAEYIPYDSVDNEDRNNNIDYRLFRSKPIVKNKSGDSYLYNLQVFVEQLYNSVVFSLKDIWDVPKENFFSFYNKRFIEEYLFHRTMLNVVSSSHYHYPSRNTIMSSEEYKEKKDAPDFYIRGGEKLFLFECKGIMINGRFKEMRGDLTPLYEELKKKLYGYTDNKGNEVYEGVRQLVKHIKNIENDDNGNTFPWDNNLPNDVCYYPILVLQDPKLIQCGLMAILNEWFYEEMRLKGLIDVAHRPVIPVSIDILFLYDGLFRKKGLDYYIDCFVLDNGIRQMENGFWSVSAFADFNQFMLSYGNRKEAYYCKYSQSIIKPKE